MKNPFLLPTWAPRVKPYLIRQLSENDTQGMPDVELLGQVGWALYSRCDSFLQARAVSLGRVRCPACSATIGFEMWVEVK